MVGGTTTGGAVTAGSSGVVSTGGGVVVGGAVAVGARVVVVSAVVEVVLDVLVLAGRVDAVALTPCTFTLGFPGPSSPVASTA